MPACLFIQTAGQTAFCVLGRAPDPKTLSTLIKRPNHNVQACRKAGHTENLTDVLEQQWEGYPFPQDQRVAVRLPPGV